MACAGKVLAPIAVVNYRRTSFGRSGGLIVSDPVTRATLLNISIRVIQ